MASQKKLIGCLMALPQLTSLTELRLGGWWLLRLPGEADGLPPGPPPLLCMPRLQVGWKRCLGAAKRGKAVWGGMQAS